MLLHNTNPNSLAQSPLIIQSIPNRHQILRHNIVGFPMGGKQISVTRGVISRIDVDTLNVLRIQIDAAINPG